VSSLTDLNLEPELRPIMILQYFVIESLFVGYTYFSRIRYQTNAKNKCRTCTSL